MEDDHTCCGAGVVTDTKRSIWTDQILNNFVPVKNVQIGLMWLFDIDLSCETNARSKVERPAHWEWHRLAFQS